MRWKTRQTGTETSAEVFLSVRPEFKPRDGVERRSPQQCGILQVNARSEWRPRGANPPPGDHAVPVPIRSERILLVTPRLLLHKRRSQANAVGTPLERVCGMPPVPTSLSNSCKSAAPALAFRRPLMRPNYAPGYHPPSAAGLSLKNQGLRTGCSPGEP